MVSIDAPLYGDQPPVQISLADGKASTSIAPFFTEVDAVQREAFLRHEKDRFDHLDEQQMEARIGPSDAAGSVFLFATGWCTKGRARCDAGEVCMCGGTACAIVEATCSLAP